MPRTRARHRAIDHRRRPVRADWGGVLFEVMLAIGLFAGAAAFTLAAVRSVHLTLDRSQKQQQAIDLARTRMAEFEAGLLTLGDLRGESAGAADSPAKAARDAGGFDEQASPTETRWRMEVSTARTEFAGLTLVEVAVIARLPPAAEAAGANPIRFTLRQLVAVRADDGDAWQTDELADGLPAMRPDGSGQ
jgi:hypothetical protein